MRKALDEFIEALEEEDPAAFISIVESHVSHHEGADIEELLNFASRKDMVAVCNGLLHQIELGVALFAQEEQDQPYPADGLSETRAKDQEAGCEVLIGTAIVARIAFARNANSPPETLHQAAALLHDHGLLEANDFPSLQDEVSKLCLDWWQTEAPGRERLTPQTVPYLLVAALQSGSAAAVKRCHSIRTALELFDFDDSSIGDLKRLLLRAAFAPSFLRCAEGRRFLAYLFTLQPSFVRELTAIIKNQIPAGRKSVLDAYGEILYRAWTTATGACLLEVQHACIQELMEAAMLASTPTLAVSIRRVLSGLHRQKHQPGVDKMLLELYQPIIFRRLNAANAAVRRNTFEVFVDSFPLRDPEESNEQTDARMTDQFASITAALRDPIPNVRMAAVQGVYRILGVYWELIPAPVTAGYLKILTGELAFDGASPAVRHAVVQGISTLVDNPLAQPLLKVVLPKLAPQLQDPSPKVRAAFVDLLLAICSIRGLQWQGFVDVQVLLEAIASDVPSVCERIQKLLLPSYFPDVNNGPPLIAALLRTSPEAGRAFCCYLTGTQPGPMHTRGVAAVTLLPGGPTIAAHYLAALAKELTTHLLDIPLAADDNAAVATKKGGHACGRRKRRKCQKNKGVDGDGDEEEIPVVENVTAWLGILRGLEAICCGLGVLIHAGKIEASPAKGIFFGDALSRLSQRWPAIAAEVSAVVSRIVAALPSVVGATEIRSTCVERLVGQEQLPAGAENNALYELAMADLECLMGNPASQAELVNAISVAIGANAEDLWSSESRHGKRHRKNVAYDFFAEGRNGLTQAAAVRYLAMLLQLDGSRRILMEAGIMKKLIPFLHSIMQERAQELAKQVADGRGAPTGSESRARAIDCVLVCMRGSLHMVLAGKCKPADEAHDGRSDEGKAYCDHFRKIFENVTMLLESLLAVDIDVLITAMASQMRSAVQATKRMKAGRVKGRHRINHDVEMDGKTASLHDAYAMAHAGIALAAEAVALGAIEDLNTRAAVGRASMLFLDLIQRVLIRCASYSSESSDRCRATVSSAVAHVTRLCRHMLSTTCEMTESLMRNLGTDLAQAPPCVDASEMEDPSLPKEDGSSPHDVATRLMRLLCQDTTGAAVEGARPHMTGFVAALLKPNAGNALNGQWMLPIAEALAVGIDIDAVLSRGGDVDVQHDENANPETGLGKHCVLNSELGDTLSLAVSTPIVKYVVASAKLVKGHEIAAGQATMLATKAWREGDALTALGLTELAQTFGFKGINVRGRSNVGDGSFDMAIRELRLLAEDMAEAVRADDPPTAILHNKLAVLLPKPPRVKLVSNC